MSPLIAYLILLSSLIALLYLFYLLHISVKLGKKKPIFSCTLCGKCCRMYKVRLTETDIKRIESAGHKRADFMKGSCLKRLADKSCIFLKENNGKYYCSIHDCKPDACRKWPFAKLAGIELASSDCPELKKMYN